MLLSPAPSSRSADRLLRTLLRLRLRERLRCGTMLRLGETGRLQLVGA
jgi:hypothetical protein